MANTKKTIKKEKVIKDKKENKTIKKEEIKVKETKKVKEIKENKKENKFINWLKNNSSNIYFLLIGIGIGFCSIFFFIPERIAKLENNEEPVVMVDGLTITANDYYETLKDNISVELLLQDIDKHLLDNLYETTKSMKKEINNEIDSIIEEYTSYYNYTEKEFLKANNLKDRDTFFELLLIDHKRQLYYEDYLRKQITNDEIVLYYNELSPDMEIKYIITESEDTAKEIISDLNKDKNYNDIIKDYKSSITYQNLGYVSFDNENIDSNILDNAKTLKTNSYSKQYITLDSGYAIIFKGNEKEKANIDDLRERIIEKIKSEKIEEDTDNTLYYRSLINLREENNITFKDTVLEKEYNEYVGQYK